MATTTNFGWSTPDDSDLVKDGALAIRTLGSAIDTSLVDLKGGTTGQVLSKNSNTDMDFTWVTSDDADAIQNSIVDAKGDLISATADNTPARLAVGNPGETLVADSSASVGLSYRADWAAGKNKIINGDFNVWQRGTSFSYTGSAAVAFSADRWYHYSNGNGSWTFSRQTFTPGTAPVAGYEGIYFARASLPTAGTTTALNWGQKIENVQTLAGQTVTVSFWAKADSSRTFNFAFEQNFGSGGSGSVTTSGANLSITTNWARYTTTVTLPSISGKTIGTSSCLILYINNGSVTNGFALDIWGVQLEAGSVATAFQTATGTLAGEFLAASRYYYRHSPAKTFPTFGIGNASSATNCYTLINLPVQMRTNPTSLEYGGNFSLYDSGFNAVSAMTIDIAGLSTVALAVTSTGLTSTRAYRLIADNSTTAYIGFSAEL